MNAEAFKPRFVPLAPPSQHNSQAVSTTAWKGLVITMRRKDDSLRATLLDCARIIAASEGTDAVSIRRIAKQAGIATGTVYNYFASKEEILLALTEEYWNNTLLELGAAVGPGPFVEQLAGMYDFLLLKISGSAASLMASLRQAAPAGRERMQSMQRVLRDSILRRMEQDAAIRPDVWTGPFTRERYADFVFMNLILTLQRGERDASFFLELVKRTLY